MTVLTKICGINSLPALAAAIEGGADMVGFVFYPPSPRHLITKDAAILVNATPTGIDRVGVFVDPNDALLDDVLTHVRLDLLQLHGSESLKRMVELRKTFGLPLIKAIKVETAADVAIASEYDGAADWLLFDAKPPQGGNALPGGNAKSFDWRLLAGRKFRRPWLLSGGLNVDNLAEAVALSGAVAVDVSSGVESAPGKKEPALIKAFLDAAKSL